MKLYVMRHGYAGESLSDPKAERQRPLKPEGREMVKAVANWMLANDEVPTIIFASPFERAKQTADIVGAIFGIGVDIVDDMAPNRPLDNRLLEFIGHGDLRRLMIVGHVDNTTPTFNRFGGKFRKSVRDSGDDKLIENSQPPASMADNGDYFGDWPPLVMAEARRLRIDRKTGEWNVRCRVRPSDLGLTDYT